MNTPLYKRRWFKTGLVFVGIGLFCYFLSAFQTAGYEKQYPELKMDDTDKFLDKLAKPLEEKNKDKTVITKEDQKKNDITLHHKIYSNDRYEGLVFGILGVLLMLISTKEPQVPDLDELDRLEELERSKNGK